VLGERPAQVVDRAHRELVAQPPQRLRPQARDAQQRDDLARVLAPQRLELRDRSALEELADLVRRALADPLDLLELAGGEPAEIGRLRGDRLRRALVGAGAERLRVLLVDLRELGELAQHVEHVLLGVRHDPLGSLPG
jgi:hypothetical protein